MADVEQEAEKFSLPSQSSDKYKELVGEQPSEEGMGGKFSELMGKIRSNWKIVAIIALLVVIAAAVLMFIPRSSGRVSIGVSLIDSPGVPIVGATVSLLDAENSKSVTPDGYTDMLGIVKFQSVPAEKDLILEVSPLEPEYSVLRKRMRFKEGESVSMDVEIEKRNTLSFDKGNYEVLLAQGCVGQLVVPVSNLDQTDFETDFVFPEELQNVITSDGPVVVPAGGEAYLSASLQYPANMKSDMLGSVRLKYTANRKFDLAIRKTDKKAKLSVDFVSRDASDIKGEVAELPIVKKSQIKIKNSGSTGAVLLSDVEVSVKGDFAAWTKLDLSSLEEANAKGGIKPGEEVLVQMTVTIPLNTNPIPYKG
ncbi:MAG: hypothetical protein V1658_03470, partial [Candidatus Micrarchaeota archaeon]